MSKSSVGTYDKYEFAWGGVVTNKMFRNKKEFAVMFCPNGTRAHKINYETFQFFFGNRIGVEHIYIDDRKIDKLVKDLTDLEEEVYDMVLVKVEEKISARNSACGCKHPCPCK
jgi:hypothetical protein